LLKFPSAANGSVQGGSNDTTSFVSVVNWVCLVFGSEFLNSGKLLVMESSDVLQHKLRQATILQQAEIPWLV
jgi:hypothetical protein